MPLTPVSLFVAIFILITPALAADQASEQEITVNASNLYGFGNLMSEFIFVLLLLYQ